jgi:hypothetical protein
MSSAPYFNQAMQQFFDKQRELQDERDKTNAANLGIGGAGGVLAKSGIGDLRNKRVAVSYGLAPGMGRGHETPANEIVSLLEELKKESKGSRGFLKDIEIVKAPVTTYEGGLDPAVARRIKRKKFLTGIDSGWGLFDPERRFKTSSRPGFRDLPDRITGNKVVQRDPFFLRNFENFLTFQPDGRSDKTGYLSTGDAQRVRRAGDMVQATYGDFDPAVARYLSNDKMRYMGRAHPLIPVGSLSKPLGRLEYATLVSDYLKKEGIDMSPEEIMKKKILTVSGASRGDTVGARARWVHDMLQKGGRNLDDHLILGIGAGGREREKLIAQAGGNTHKNLIIGPGKPTPAEFTDLINNSDLHIRGMGGAVPFETLAHGGAPLAGFGDEQVFRSAERKPWASSKLQRRKGIHGYERRLIALINKHLPKDQRLAESPPRDWMNASYHGYGKNEEMMRRGLDGIRRYDDLRGFTELDSKDPSSFFKALDNPMSAEQRKFNSELTKKDIAAGRALFKDLLKERLTAARLKAVTRGGLKTALGGGLALGGLGAILANQGPEKPASSPFDFTKRSSQRDPNYGLIGAGAGLSALGAGAYDTGRSLLKVPGVAKPYMDAIDAYVSDYKTPLRYTDTFDPERAMRFLKTMDTYAEGAQDMSKLRVMGIPAHYITRKFPLASLHSDRKNTILNGLGLGRFVPDDKRWTLMDAAEHYRGAGGNFRSTLAREMLSNAADREMRIAPDVTGAMDAEEVYKIVGAPKDVKLSERFGPFVERAGKGEVPAAASVLNSPFSSREHKMLFGLEPHQDFTKMTPAQIRKAIDTSGVKGYGNLLSSIAGKYGKKMKIGGGITGATGLGLATLGLMANRNN